ncbi:MAG: hypothetical protein AABX33_08485 [Nanoarchaeota archaeon]
MIAAGRKVEEEEEEFNESKMTQITVERLHPVLRFLVGAGCEETEIFSRAIIKDTSNGRKSALNLTERVEDDETNIIGHTKVSIRRLGSFDVPVYGKKTVFRVGFGTEIYHHYQGDFIAVVLNGVRNASDCYPQLKQIATELKEICRLDYEPWIYKEG